MSAAVLREAAALMRERAEAATEGPWFPHDGTPYYQPTVLTVSEGPGGMSRIPDGAWIAECGPASIKGRENTEHIASWHPVVALAVADLLDEAANRLTAHEEQFGDREAWLKFCKYAYGHPLTVAHAYLGRES